MRFIDRLLFADRLERMITNWDPADRRRTAIRGLVLCTYFMLINVTLYVTGVINVNDLILITLILSWLALNITFIDIVGTTDVRTEVAANE